MASPFLQARILLAITSLFISSTRLFADDLKIDLTAHRIVQTAGGEETKAVAESASPGDVIEYRAAYLNTTPAALRNLRPEVPIPYGLTFVAGSDKPAAAQARLESGKVVPYPPKDADGKPLPISSVRALIWTLDDLPAAESRTLVLRATVNR